MGFWEIVGLVLDHSWSILVTLIWICHILQTCKMLFGILSYLSSPPVFSKLFPLSNSFKNRLKLKKISDWISINKFNLLVISVISSKCNVQSDGFGMTLVMRDNEVLWYLVIFLAILQNLPNFLQYFGVQNPQCPLPYHIEGVVIKKH